MPIFLEILPCSESYLSFIDIFYNSALPEQLLGVGGASVPPGVAGEARGGLRRPGEPPRDHPGENEAAKKFGGSRPSIPSGASTAAGPSSTGTRPLESRGA